MFDSRISMEASIHNVIDVFIDDAVAVLTLLRSDERLLGT